MPTKYAESFKRSVIQRYKQGESILALCQELRIAQSTFYRLLLNLHCTKNLHACRI